MTSNRLMQWPIYLQVCDALTKRIASGMWKPGQAIPNESELARELGVSGGTVRKALEILEGRQLLSRRQGRGTFVIDPQANGLLDRFCGLRGPDNMALPGSIEVLGLTHDVATEAERARLLLEAAEAVWRVQRVRRDRERPFMYERVALPTRLFPRIRADAPERIVALAYRHGHILATSEERLSLGTASTEAAAALAIAPGAPVLVLDRVVRTSDGQPAEWRLAECNPGDGYYLSQVSRSSAP